MKKVRVNFQNRFVLAFVIFLVLILVGTSGYRWLEGMSFIDALYMTVITISTVGYGEVRTLSEMGRIFTIFLILGGGGVVGFALTVGVDYIMSGKWQGYREKRRHARMLSELNNHVIICGFGRVGKNVTDELKAEGVPFIVIDIDPEEATQAEEHGCLAVTGNAANETVLHEVGINKARALVAAVNSDAENVFITLTARSLQPELYIVARANYEDSTPKLLRAGANHTIMPYHISGKRIAATLMRPSVADFLDGVVHVGGLEMLLEEVHIESGSEFAGKTVAETQIRGQLGITILACRAQDGDFDTRVGPKTILQPGGVLIVLGTREQLNEMMKFARAK
ncbi:MAG: potassium channel protein [Anaerolineae bacterium]|jgi:voltage-gated potassium channel|nr:potassium channel protein [Anaerolineae bacterium]MBT7070846.1 potassium channel protein [Anaerolineae bacterium]MBT7324350.1 potassium channel protein [Anaerolineae bacterium]